MSAKHLIACIALLAGAAVSPLALAHAHLRDPVPAMDANVVAPPALVLTFSEAIEAAFSSVTLLDDQGRSVALPAVQVTREAPNTLRVAPLPALSSGTYTVQWKVLSVDTHKSAGSYCFKVGQ